MQSEDFPKSLVYVLAFDDAKVDKVELVKYIRRFSTNSILQKIHQETSSMITKGEHEKSIAFQLSRPGETLRRQFFVLPWRLIDFAYFAIVNTDDQTSPGPTDEEFYFLYYCIYRYYAAKESLSQKNAHDSGKFLLHLWGMLGEQIKMQVPSSILENNARELYILIDLLEKRKDDYHISVPDIIQKETGVGWDIIVSSLFLLFYFYGYGNYSLEKSVTWTADFSESDFSRVLNKYTVTYDEVKHSCFGRQIFYLKPYVLTRNRTLICVNSFLGLQICEHPIIWIIRDYFKKTESGEFLSVFGRVFEDYFGELLTTYGLSAYENLNKNKELQRKGVSITDWRFELFNHHFLVEQKSAFTMLNAKQQNSDVDSTTKYISDTILKAMQQLRSTEKQLSDGEYIKIILLYDDYYIPEIIDQVFTLPDCDITDDKRYWIVTIGEMEQLLYLYKNNPAVCQIVLNEKCQIENSKSIDGRRLSLIYHRHGLDTNPHIRQSPLKYYYDYALNRILTIMRY